MTVVQIEPQHTTSPTAGIQEAIDALPDAGGTVVIPAGRHLVRRSIQPRSGVTLRGEGAATVLTRRAPVAFNLTATCGENADTVAVDSVDGLQVGDEVNLFDTTQGGWHGRQFVIHAIDGTTLRGAIVAGSPKRTYAPENGAAGRHDFPMIYVDECNDVTIESLTIDGGDHGYTPADSASFTCAAVHTATANNLRVDRVTVKGWPADGISVQRGRGATVTHCLVEDCLSHGLHPGTHLTESVWTNNISRRNRAGFYFCVGVRHAVVTDNLFVDNRGCGIDNLGDPDRDNVVQGNIIARNGLYGIEGRGALHNVIANNIVQDNSQRCPGIFPGIYLRNHKGNVVRSNRCHDTQDNPTQGRGLMTEDDLGDNLIADNLVTDADVPPPPDPGRASLRRADGAIELNGRLDEDAWQAADVLAASARIEDGMPAEVMTEFRVLYDATHLYVGVRCDEPRMDRVFDRMRERGDNVWRENAVEMVITPPGDDAPTYHLSVNTLATLFEKRHEGQDLVDWPAGAQAAVHRGDDFWSAEVAVPLTAFAVESVKPGDVWRCNFSRHRTTVRPNEIAAWSPTYGSIYRPARFGWLTAD